MAHWISQEILANLETLSQAILARQVEIQADLAERYSGAVFVPHVWDTQIVLQNLAQALALDSPLLFSDYISWLKIVLESREIPLRDLRIHLHCMQQILSQQFGVDHAAHLAEFLDAARAELEKTMPNIYYTRLRGDYAGLARQYLNCLLSGDGNSGVKLAVEAVERGEVSLRDLYMNVLQPAQLEIGRLWQFNQTDDARGHVGAETTLRVMDLLQPRLHDCPANGLSMAAVCAGDERHEIGIRMVVDFFKLEGWDGRYLGCNIYPAFLAQQLVEHPAQVLAISATLSTHLEAVEKLIQAVRAGDHPGIHILVGGYPFNLIPNLWRQIGADGFAPDASEAVRLARELLPG